MLIALIAASLIALLAGQALPKAFAAAPAFWAHIALAIGVMTLITAAMQHFVPVLARTRGVSPRMARLPLLMLLAGALVVVTLGGWLDFRWIVLAALLGLVGAVSMVVWMLGKARQALGRPHPGLNWYVAAMACLGLALVAAMLIPILPGWHAELRTFHLHLNLYGFVGLTAVGTLQVLMPTAAGQADPQAALRLKQDLKWALAGALGIALGEVFWSPLSWLGVAAWLWVLARMAWAWWRLHRQRMLSLHGAEPVLAAALLGYACALVGVLQAHNNPLLQFLPAFLFPLVTGAAGVLAPVWLNPAQPATHAAGRQALNRWGSVRAVFFMVSGILPLLGYQCSGMPALTALVWFGILFAVWLYSQ